MSEKPMRCAILDDYQSVATTYGDFAALDARIAVTGFAQPIAEATLAETLAPFDIIVAMRERTPFPAELLAALPNLKLLVTTGMRNASIDLAAAHANRILVCGTPGFAGSTAELAFALMLGLARKVPQEAGNLRAGGWQTSVGRDLKGLTLGLIGLGTLGAKVARIARAFEMDVHAYSRNNTPERSAALDVTCAPDLDAMLGASDIVSIHVTLTPETRGLIDTRRLSLLKPTALLINTSRGPIVDEAALVAALQAGKLAGAGLDVFDHEPLPTEHPFRTLPNVLATPHLGYVTENTYRIFYGGAVEAIAAWLDGKPVRVLTSA